MAELVDQARIEVRAGRGGDGASHFLREKYHPRGGPDGGDGGRGGDVILVADPDQSTLVDFLYRHHFTAGDGGAGSGKHRHGADGGDQVVKVPAGTLVYDDDTGALLGDLVSAGDRLIICRGGGGGQGNASFATPTNQAPVMRELGEPGETRRLRLELKLLADVALVGYPNAGKSTLISRLSAARPKIADYPFTTLSPNLGVVRVDYGRSFVVADLPGLIDGAAEGRGLGHRFLRHLERARVIVHLLDVSGIERPDPVADYDAIRAELVAYDPGLAELPELVAANKIDLPDGADMAELVAEELQARGVSAVYPVSAVTGAGLPELVRAVSLALAAAPATTLVARRSAAEAAEPEPEPDDSFAIEQLDQELYQVSGAAVERAMAICDLNNDEAVMRLHRKLVRMGVIDALREAGCRDGDVVRIGGVEMDYED